MKLGVEGAVMRRNDMYSLTILFNTYPVAFDCPGGEAPLPVVIGFVLTFVQQDVSFSIRGVYEKTFHCQIFSA
jgi:hypothetical protein